MKEPLVTIITVCLNSKETILQTIESVLNQTYKNIEYIVVDGVSEDGTLDIIKNYADRNPNCLKYISEKDNGIYDAMNKGIEMARGSLIGILNSDDWYENDAVQTVIEHFNEGKKVIYGSTKNWENELEESVTFYRHEFLEKRMINHPSCFVSKEVYEKIGKFSLKYKLVSDYDLLLRMFISKEVEFIPVYKVLTNFRSGGVSGGWNSEKEVNQLKRQYGLISKQHYMYRCIVLTIVKLLRKN